MKGVGKGRKAGVTLVSTYIPESNEKKVSNMKGELIGFPILRPRDSKLGSH